MTVDLLIAGLGLVILLLAGDALVRGAVNIALRLGIPALIVSLTIVAFGTSAPELLISVKAVRDNAGGLALGNVVGSNIANVLLVLGVPALMRVLATRDHDTRRSFVFMIAATLLFIAACFFGPIRWWHGLVLVAALSGVLWDAIRTARSHRRTTASQDYGADDAEELEGADPSMPWWKIGVFTVLGLVGLPLGADLLVDSSVRIATVLGVSDTVIGLTLVAIGTSLPELATTVMAALRNQADVALGNVIGSNMFNLLAIIGLASFVGPIPVDPEIQRFDLWVMLAAALALIPFVFLRQNMGRLVGVVFSLLYVAYLVVVVS
ncbi:calcium/sodium antiporter [Vannielia litorea]|uniref:Cation:H+ antiporter n=1 Tax=Vannielia litorea TaxID=1217970 RepID=A0A1N6HDX3_9RHOB|nr:calcium/sodium antiporter [Vannielia litorea]SIO17933.1 cation:H+ antiporter [Vannielia litorea]